MAIKGGKPTEHRVVAHLVVPNGAEAVDYYRRALGAQVLYASEIPGTGRIIHAHLKIEQSVIMLTEEMLRQEGADERAHAEAKLAAPQTLGGTSVMLELYVDDVDAAFRRATEAGGSTMLAPSDQFYGDRYGILRDPFGHLWALATVKEELTPEEVNRRAMELFAPAHS